jgi:ferritin-like metal-binding protein YciE
MGIRLEGEHCEAMAGIIREGEELMNQLGDSAVKDAGLIASAQRVEHYEIAGYGTARTYAKQARRERGPDLQQSTHAEESSPTRS